MKIPNKAEVKVVYTLSLARIVSEDSQPRERLEGKRCKSSKDS